MNDETWATILAHYPDAKRPAGPGDGGPCHICGEDMRAKEYDSGLDWIFPDGHKVSGRYWHMTNEHHIWEDYISPDRFLANLGKEKTMRTL